MLSERGSPAWDHMVLLSPGVTRLRQIYSHGRSAEYTNLACVHLLTVHKVEMLASLNESTMLGGFTSALSINLLMHITGFSDLPAD